MNSPLPDGFQPLEPFLGWALETEAERTARRAASTFEQVRSLYDAVFPLLVPALEHLKAYQLDELPARSRTLLLVLLSYAEAALVVENFGQVAVPQGFEISKFQVRRLGGSF